MSWKSIALGLAVTGVGGCADTRVNPQPPALPAAYAEPTASGTPYAALFAAFGSPELDALIRSAQQTSPDLAAAVARVKQADARVRQAGGALLPEVDADLNATQFGGGSRGGSAHETDWSALVSASYEVDFWGKNRAARQSVQAAADASRADLATVRTTLLTAVASTYFEIQSLRERIALARSNLATATELSQFIEARADAGSASAAELAAQRAAVANVELFIPQLQQQESEAVSALAVLTGRPPEGFDVPTQPLDGVTEPIVAAGLPAELLQRRPDLVAAEDELHAAHADVAAARAAMFPSLNLTASGGVANPAVAAAVITLAGTGYSLTAGADVVQTLFDNGRRRAVTREAAAREEELVAAYRGAIYSALRDVENALAQVRNLELQRRPEEDFVAQSKRAFDGLQLRYREGAAEYVAVLESQRTVYAAREQFGEYKLARLQALLGLSKALGGGWQQ